MTDTNVFTCIGGIAEQVAVQYALYGADVAQAIDIRRIINTGNDPHTVRDAQEKQCPEKRRLCVIPIHSRFQDLVGNDMSEFGGSKPGDWDATQRCGWPCSKLCANPQHQNVLIV